MDESAEERRRVAALRAAAGHPLRCRRLQLRHDQEREEKRTLISWIRRDIEVPSYRVFVWCLWFVVACLLGAACPFAVLWGKYMFHQEQKQSRRT